MCTLIVATRVWQSTPLLVAANRDERLDRPAEPPRLWTDRPIPLLAPRDVTAGGTWIGLSAARVFAGVTNRFGSPPDPTRRTRGEIVLLALAKPTAKDGAREIAALEPSRYNPFHLVVADERAAFLIVNTSESMTLVELAPGIHIATERSFNTGTTAREQLIRSRLGPLESKDPPSDEALKALLAMRGEPSYDGVAVRMPELNYGTRSSTIVRLGDKSELLHAEGPPDEAPFIAQPLAALDL
jgi:uncharacterized protein with NRDE domain